MKKKNKINKQGFTMIEVIAAIFIITVGALGVFSLVYQTISYLFLSHSRLTAFYLAQEGVEIVINIRDSNWLKARKEEIPWNHPWDTGLGDEGPWEADYKTEALGQSYVGSYLNIISTPDGDFYGYGSGISTKFKRKITISDKDILDLGKKAGDPTDVMKVTVEVFWEERGRGHEVAVEKNLYCWDPVCWPTEE